MQIYKDGMEFVPHSQQHATRQQPPPGPGSQQLPPGHTGQQPPPAGTTQYGDRSPSRPSSLEIQNHNQYMASMHGQNAHPPPDYDPHCPQQGQGPPPYSTGHPDTQGMANGTLSQAWDGRTPQGNQVPEYNAPPPYNHNHNIDEYKHNYDGYEQAQFNNNTKQYNTESADQQHTPQDTPSRRTPGSRAPSTVASPRPSAPPPAPPGMHKVDSPMGTSRESLPPPPPPPPLDGMQIPSHMSPASIKGTPLQFGSPGHIQGLRDSPARHPPSPQLGGKCTTPDSIDIPPPPPPPPLMHTPDTPNSMNSMPPPPPTPPPMEPQLLSTLKSPGHMSGLPPPAPPPPPPGGMMVVRGKMPNGDVTRSPKTGHNSSLTINHQSDAVSIASNASSNTISSGSTMKSDENGAPVRDTRCDLLAAIREGLFITYMYPYQSL